MNIITSLIIGISIIISVFLNNYYSDDRYSPYYVENEEYSNHFVTYVTDKMTGNVERITYKVFKDPKDKSQTKSVYIERLDMESGLRKSIKPTGFDPTRPSTIVNPFDKFDPDEVTEKNKKVGTTIRYLDEN